jgi:DNA-binding NtrC family response regulator
MRRVLEQLDRITDSTANVLVEGESGTGKELVARAIHFNGERRGGPFIGVNCAALPETLLESELFGHVRGAFTGADRDKKGLLVEANGGTLFLDELGEMPLGTQAKLLRVIQEREVRPVGAARSVPFDLRLVCATHRDLVAEVAAGRFREDLYYRIAVVGVKLPALRERAEDIPVLALAILERLGQDANRPVPVLDSSALRLLTSQPWPGNVRQLENTLTRAFVLNSSARLGATDLMPPQVGPLRAKSRTRHEFEDEERTKILELLRSSRWNVSLVARTLAIPRNSFYRKLLRYGLTRENAEEASFDR